MAFDFPRSRRQSQIFCSSRKMTGFFGIFFSLGNPWEIWKTFQIRIFPHPYQKIHKICSIFLLSIGKSKIFFLKYLECYGNPEVFSKVNCYWKSMSSTGGWTDYNWAISDFVLNKWGAEDKGFPRVKWFLKIWYFQDIFLKMKKKQGI